MDKLETYIWATNTGWGVSLDEREDLEITGSEVVRHRDLDCGKRFGDEVYCVSRAFYKPSNSDLSRWYPGRHLEPRRERVPCLDDYLRSFPWYLS